MKYKLERTINDAIMKGYFHQVRLLVALGYNVNQPNKKGQTPLMLCALIQNDNWSVGIARTLLETHLVAVGKTDFRGLTALHYACIYDMEALINVLLDYSGFNTQALDLLRNRPMHYAAVTGNSRIVQMLLGYEMKLGVKPSTWMTANIAGMTPVALAKRFQRSDCYVVLKDLTGDVKFPSKRDLKESRMLNDFAYAKMIKDKKLFKKPTDEKLIDKNMPSWRLRMKVKMASNRYKMSSFDLEKSHLENVKDMSVLPKYCVHYSFDFNSLNYRNEPMFEEKLIYVRPDNLEPESVDDEEIASNDSSPNAINQSFAKSKMFKSSFRTIRQTNILQNKSVVKSKFVRNSNFENKNRSNVNDEKDENVEKSDETKSKSSTEESTVDYSKACKRYEIQDVVFDTEADEKQQQENDREDDSEENNNGEEEKGEDEDEEKEESSDHSVKITQTKIKEIEKKDNMEEDEEEECPSDVPFLDEFGGFYTTETAYRHSTIPKPFLQNFRYRCIQDRNKLRCLCKPPPGTITNVEEKFGRKIVSRYLAAVLLDVILPAYEKGPPFSKKCEKLIAWVYDNGLLNRDLMKENLIAGHNMMETRLCDLYAREYRKVSITDSEDYPLCSTDPRSKFCRHVIERKKKMPKPCCLTCRKTFLMDNKEPEDKTCKDWTGDDIVSQLRYHYGYQKSHSYVKSFVRT
ncbi:hypothetical protein HELRODRAFT_171041 [Helobdella robusta]|uniref:Uncharacterized protein n=1 Tax=Helobdella robusta TaxID=6412 RepID=T1F3Q9_HELRO|nr:hypothetical protein HELRODRAFT_171041 [Helobdella robusta]ESO07004.1 hypothetical protein HELRODRAFT_171041 [Helobdella robusta]